MTAVDLPQTVSGPVAGPTEPIPKRVRVQFYSEAKSSSFAYRPANSEMARAHPTLSTESFMRGPRAGMSPSDRSLVKEFGDFLNIQQKELQAVKVLQIGFCGF